MKIIINTPLITIPAGVSNHYFGLRPYFSKDVIYNQFLPGHYIDQFIKYKLLSRIVRLTLLVYDLMKFLFILLIHRKPVVLLNSSFRETAMKRDTLFLLLAKILNYRAAVFLHGWDDSYLYKILNGEVKLNFVWRRVDAFVVLSKEYKENLKKLGFDARIILTTTKVNDDLLGIQAEEKKIQVIKNILFLGRVEEAKGIFTTIDAIEILNKKSLNIMLRVVGYGSILEQVKFYVKKKAMHNITFTGPLEGNDLREEFLEADLYILPTLSEGMPTSVLEAMAFGLPIITRPVGGLKDFFENGKMGYMIESLDPEVYANHIENLMNNIELVNRISRYNKNYAKENFMASKVAKTLELNLKTI